MRSLINKKFTDNKWRFFAQSLLLLAFMMCVLVALFFVHSNNLGKMQVDLLTAIGASSLSASAFIVFALPGSAVGKPSRILGGYVIGLLSGVGWHSALPQLCHLTGCDPVLLASIAGAIASGVAMLLMGLLDFSHPPAMGLSLGLVLDAWDGWTLFVVLVAVIVLCVLKKIVNRWLITLLP